jgi:GNAT superfamily N-acetyltransferase
MATAFRLLRRIDVEPMLRTLEGGHRESGQPFDEAGAREWLRGLIGNPGAGCAWLIERDGMPVGCAILAFGAEQSQPRRAYVTGLYVEPRLRGRGIGDLALALLRSVGSAHERRVEAHDVAGEQKLPRIPVARPVLPPPVVLNPERSANVGYASFAAQGSAT